MAWFLSVYHSKTTRLTFTIALLAIAVFCWGTRYKLSLYSNSNRAQTNVAKLLSEAERPPKPAPLAIKSPRAIPPAVTLLSPLAILWITLPQLAWRAIRGAATERPLRLLVHPTTSSALRGPPITAL